jgi:thioredoxin-like negative regulator of GroEL
MTEADSNSGKVVALFSRQIRSLTDHEFYGALAEVSGPSIVFFTKPGCSSCHLWKRLLDELLQLRSDIHVFQVDAEQNMALSHEYELFHLPALFLFVDGEFHRELQSEASLSQLQATLDVALNSPAEEAP